MMITVDLPIEIFSGNSVPCFIAHYLKMARLIPPLIEILNMLMAKDQIT